MVQNMAQMPGERMSGCMLWITTQSDQAATAGSASKLYTVLLGVGSSGIN